MQTIDTDRVRDVLADAELAWPAGIGVAIARFVGVDADGRFQVELPGVPEAATAVSTIALAAADAGASVVVAYESGDLRRPVIVGRAYQRATPEVSGLKVDGERVVIRGEREIELRCGDASIVLTRAGKVLIRGTYVLTRSRGANKIKGAFVDIN
jgi:hypothetical protein